MAQQKRSYSIFPIWYQEEITHKSSMVGDEQEKRKRIQFIKPCNTALLTHQPVPPHHSREERSVGTSPTVSWKLVSSHWDPHWSEPEHLLRRQLTSGLHLRRPRGEMSGLPWKKFVYSDPGKVSMAKSGFLCDSLCSDWKRSLYTHCDALENPLERLSLKEERGTPQIRWGRSGHVSWGMENSLVPRKHTCKEHWNNWSTFYVKS